MNRAERSFIEEVLGRTGHPDPESVAQAIGIAMRGLGSQLSEDPAAVEDALSGELLQAMRQGHRLSPMQPDAIYDEVVAATRLRPGVVLELVQSALAVLAQRLEPDARAELRAAVSPEWAALLADPRPRSEHHPPAPVPVELGQGDTLATGRPGARDSLAEAAPPAGQSHSVAVEDEPHADTSLATARGISSERDDDSLSKGRPGSRHPVSGSD